MKQRNGHIGTCSFSDSTNGDHTVPSPGCKLSKLISVAGKMTVTGGDKDNLHSIVAADGQIHFELNAFTAPNLHELVLKRMDRPLRRLHVTLDTKQTISVFANAKHAHEYHHARSTATRAPLETISIRGDLSNILEVSELYGMNAHRRPTPENRKNKATSEIKTNQTSSIATEDLLGLTLTAAQENGTGSNGTKW